VTGARRRRAPVLIVAVAAVDAIARVGAASSEAAKPIRAVATGGPVVTLSPGVTGVSGRVAGVLSALAAVTATVAMEPAAVIDRPALVRLVTSRPEGIEGATAALADVGAATPAARPLSRALMAGEAPAATTLVSGATVCPGSEETVPSTVDDAGTSADGSETADDSV
jgi:hypothetical protein